jgi:hypothetical protein
MRSRHPIRNCRFWLLAMVVIVLVAASAAASQARADTATTDPVPGTTCDKDGHYSLLETPIVNGVKHPAYETAKARRELSKPKQH